MGRRRVGLPKAQAISADPPPQLFAGSAVADRREKQNPRAPGSG